MRITERLQSDNMIPQRNFEMAFDLNARMAAIGDLLKDPEKSAFA
jgi:hypothetical protein